MTLQEILEQADFSLIQSGESEYTRKAIAYVIKIAYAFGAVVEVKNTLPSMDKEGYVCKIGK